MILEQTHCRSSLTFSQTIGYALPEIVQILLYFQWKSDFYAIFLSPKRKTTLSCWFENSESSNNDLAGPKAVTCSLFVKWRTPPSVHHQNHLAPAEQTCCCQMQGAAHPPRRHIEPCCDSCHKKFDVYQAHTG